MSERESTEEEEFKPLPKKEEEESKVEKRAEKRPFCRDLKE